MSRSVMLTYKAYKVSPETYLNAVKGLSSSHLNEPARNLISSSSGY